MPKIADVKTCKAPVSQALEPEDLHRLFAEDAARWHPGGYEDYGNCGEPRALATTSAPGPKRGRAP
jgi:hypothetical protein